MNENETNTSKAQVLNIRAAKAIVETVRSTLGPMGMDKMMVDGAGNVIVTNDGATILRELDVAHPGARMMVEISKTQEALCYDGTTTTVVLAGQLLSNSETLFEKGLHPNVICRGYHEASQMALDYLLSDINNSDSESLLHEVAKTAITGKAVETSTDMVSALCVDAVMAAGEVDKVRVISLPGGSIDESYLFNGVIVSKDFVLDYDVDEDTNVMLINTGLEEEKSDENVQVQLDADSYTQFKQAGKKDLLEQAKQIVMKMNGKGIVFVRDGVHDHVCAFLRKNGIGVVRRVPESTMRALKSTLGIAVSQTPEEAEGSAVCKVLRQKHNDVYYLFVSGNVESDQSTLVLRGATQSTLDEVERGFDSLDTVLAIRNKIQNGDLSYGPDVTNGGVKDMWEAGVVEPTALIKQAVLSATEVTTSILRIDDIVSRRPVE